MNSVTLSNSIILVVVKNKSLEVPFFYRDIKLPVSKFIDLTVTVAWDNDRPSVTAALLINKGSSMVTEDFIL